MQPLNTKVQRQFAYTSIMRKVDVLCVTFMCLTFWRCIYIFEQSNVLLCMCIRMKLLVFNPWKVLSFINYNFNYMYNKLRLWWNLRAHKKEIYPKFAQPYFHLEQKTDISIIGNEIRSLYPMIPYIRVSYKWSILYTNKVEYIDNFYKGFLYYFLYPQGPEYFLRWI